MRVNFQQLELDLYPQIKSGQVVIIQGTDLTGHFDLKGAKAIVESPATGCRCGIWCWILGFKLGTIYPVILEYDIYSLEMTGEVKTPWHRMAYRTQQSMFNKFVN
ncbi:hypothetical protein [Laspinema olomoucense]|uniref:hypothetical protein n=1 Tax=Laspinema olomoucense TaxID=3231600 RepID=UPI0021BB67A1|nr:hypothetical protein [Laspinema sp. D3d]MCT7971192.1 hypothetical protein [Laspinema sp. D3d]